MIVLTKENVADYVKSRLDFFNADGGPVTVSAIGIMTIPPSDATIIAADNCTKAAYIKLGVVDRFSGSVIIVGSTANVESALNSVITIFYNKLGFDTVAITKT